MQFPHTDIYAITDSRQSLGRSNIEVARELMRAGVKILQYREKHMDNGPMLKECLAIRAITREAGCCFIINDHVDIAMLAEADGIHVGQSDLPLAAVRRLAGKDALIGVSARNMAEYQAAVDGGADYIGAGAVYATGTKTDAVITAPGFLPRIATTSPIPIVAIGGINEHTILDVAKLGVSCFAIISAITLAPDIPAKVAELRTSLLSEKA